MFRKFGTATASICLAATAVKIADSKQSASAAITPIKQSSQTDELPHYKCKPSELPVYTPLHEYNKVKPKPQEHSEDTIIRKTLESGVSVVRVEVFKVCNFISSQKKHAGEFIDTGKAHSKFIFDYLNEPDNSLPRVGAIGIGGLSGFILALRGGFIRRVFYTSIGAGIIASICYPKEAEQYAQNVLIEGKKVANIGYNFVLGVKPGDEIKVINWPKLPASITELLENTKDLIFSSSSKKEEK